jgi:hypothetical protein
MLALHSLVAFLILSSCSAKLVWKDTKFLVTFGDSYTADGVSLFFFAMRVGAYGICWLGGFNISAGVDSPVPGFVRFRTMSQLFD